MIALLAATATALSSTSHRIYPGRLGTAFRIKQCVPREDALAIGKKALALPPSAWASDRHASYATLDCSAHEVEPDFDSIVWSRVRARPVLRGRRRTMPHRRLRIRYDAAAGESAELRPTATRACSRSTRSDGSDFDGGATTSWTPSSTVATIRATPCCTRARRVTAATNNARHAHHAVGSGNHRFEVNVTARWRRAGARQRDLGARRTSEGCSLGRWVGPPPCVPGRPAGNVGRRCRVRDAPGHSDVAHDRRGIDAAVGTRVRRSGGSQRGALRLVVDGLLAGVIRRRSRCSALDARLMVVDKTPPSMNPRFDWSTSYDIRLDDSTADPRQNAPAGSLLRRPPRLAESSWEAATVGRATTLGPALSCITPTAWTNSTPSCRSTTALSPSLYNYATLTSTVTDATDAKGDDRYEVAPELWGMSYSSPCHAAPRPLHLRRAAPAFTSRRSAGAVDAINFAEAPGDACPPSTPSIKRSP